MNAEQAEIALRHLTQRNNPFRVLIAMIGASHFGTGSGGISFRFKGCSLANTCNISLSDDDTYRMRLLKIGRDMTVKTHVDTSSIYCDDLKFFFEQSTGLFLSLV